MGFVMGELFNNEKAKEKRRVLRRDAPPAEEILWARLRGRQLGGWKFRRQYSIAHFIADFCCVESKIVVEIDGPTHEEAEIYDRNRQEYLQSVGFQVVRFTNQLIYQELSNVLEHLLKLCEERR
jgi:very-short-patch-repair endonuclease